METDLQQKLIRLEQEIRDLKTAQYMPGYMNMHYNDFDVAIPTVSVSRYVPTTWTIYYANDEDTNAPISYILFDDQGSWELLEYDSATNTQKLQLCYRYNTTIEYLPAIVSSRIIDHITKD